MKIIIVSRSILPTNAPRAFRATELAKALAKQGHNVKLMAVLGNYNYTSFEVETGVEVVDIGTPSIAVRNSDGKLQLPLWKLGLIFLFRRFLDFPDILLMRKVKKAILNQGEFDMLITVAVPFSIHWGAAMIRSEERKFTTWVSDCGDPYMGNTMGSKMFYFKYVEKWWGRKTDYITIPVEDARDSYYSEFRNKIVVIPQGFDFEEVKNEEYKENIVPTFLYAGALYKEKRDPENFLHFLTTLKGDFKFIVYTAHTHHFTPFLEKLGHKIDLRSPIDRELLMKEMSTMDFLINIANSGTSAQVPSKLIDYALTERPILEISSDFTMDQKNNFLSFLQKDYMGRYRVEDIDRYNIKNVSSQFLNLHIDK